MFGLFDYNHISILAACLFLVKIMVSSFYNCNRITSLLLRKNHNFKTTAITHSKTQDYRRLVIKFYFGFVGVLCCSCIIALPPLHLFIGEESKGSDSSEDSRETIYIAIHDDVINSCEDVVQVGKPDDNHNAQSFWWGRIGYRCIMRFDNHNLRSIGQQGGWVNGNRTGES